MTTSAETRQAHIERAALQIMENSLLEYARLGLTLQEQRDAVTLTEELTARAVHLLRERLVETVQ